MNTVSSMQNPALIRSLYHTKEQCNISRKFFAHSPSTIQHQPGRLEEIIQQPHGILHHEGLVVLRSQGFFRIPGSAAGRSAFVPKRPYDDALDIASAFAARLAQERPETPPSLVWIYSEHSFFVPYPPALASRGFNLDECIFIETLTPLRALRSVCEEHFFDTVIFDHETTSAAMQMARKWLKPPSQPQVCKGSELPQARQDRLAIFID